MAIEEAPPNILLISYDLIGKERPGAYEAVIGMIEAEAISSVRALYSQWLVETDEAPAEWSAHLEAVIDENDTYLIVPVTVLPDGYLASKVIAWLKERLP